MCGCGCQVVFGCGDVGVMCQQFCWVVDFEGVECQFFFGGMGDWWVEGLWGFCEENGQCIVGGGVVLFEVGYGCFDVV